MVGFEIFVFSWNLRTLSGREQILEYLSANIDSTTITELKVSSGEYFKPSPGEVPGSGSSGFTFSTPIANGKADSDSGSEPRTWKTFTVLMSLDILKEHELISADQGVYQGSSLCWSEQARRELVRKLIFRRINERVEAQLNVALE
ncbi:hypothetical protein BT96DRAFT_1038879 [Gymnopus androsaceus JB14]|uniref:Uncharacterized protein n=1 Tax=Gymnopus androsaceus JB14 TaxID=1447944 RepID=A0A6A4HG69_9AGAR|nr:hypothetical protein BT96DRAFT_1038879 [Gymnopus androsaceus JB14]